MLLYVCTYIVYRQEEDSFQTQHNFIAKSCLPLQEITGVWISAILKYELYFFKRP